MGELIEEQFTEVTEQITQVNENVEGVNTPRGAEVFEQVNEVREQSLTTMNGFRESHAVVIGINAYGNRIPQLRTAVNDARGIGQVLESEFGYAVQLLTEDVTSGKLRALFSESLPIEVQADDRLLVYFAGHGIALDGADGPAGYLVPQDAQSDDPRTFLAMTDLSNWLNRLPCRHLLLVLDCCFAGAFRWSSTRDLGEVPDVIHKERYDRYIRDPAWLVITSAAYDQKALDVLSGSAIGLRDPDGFDGGHSPFAASYLRALQGEADLYPRAASGRTGGDGVITATELYVYLLGRVGDEAELDGHRQTPGLWPLTKHDKGEYIHLVPGHAFNLPPAPELDEANNPYRGLQSYDEEQAPLFFGRSQFVKKLAERVAGQPLTIVLGASGTGKSSVVKAGLVSFLRKISPDAWQILPPIRPGKSPLAALATLILPGEDADLGNRLTELWTDPEALAARVGAWAAREPAGRLLLVVDQFEELITLCWAAGEREQFLRLLEHALAAHADRLRVVLTLRSDFEPQFAHSSLEGDWMSSRIVVPAMTLDEYREVIEGPASVKVLYFQGKLSSREFINRLSGDVANTPGALPLLSFTLSELYRRYLERRGEDRAFWEDDYERLGGVGGSLRNRANEVYEGLPDDGSHATMKRLMLRMISIDGGELARRRVPDTELIYRDSSENARVASVLHRLTAARLIVEGQETDEPYVEPAHDELVRGWDRLLEWAREGQEGLLLRRILTPAAEDWRRGSGGLWHANPRLSLVRRVLDSPTGWLNQTEAEFVRLSVLRKRSLFVGTVSAVSVAFVVLAVITLLALGERTRATNGEAAALKTERIATKNERIAKEKGRLATSRQLAAVSASQLNVRLDRSLLLAVEAFRTKNTFEAQDSLFKGLQNAPGLRKFLHIEKGNVTGVAFSPDRKTIAAGYCRGGVALWDATTHERLAVDPLTVTEGDVTCVAFSSNGTTIAAGYSSGGAGRRGGVVLWNAAIHSRLTDDPLFVTEGDIDCVAISPEGTTIAAGYYGGVVLWDVGTRQRLTADAFPVTEGFVKGVAFSPDGKTIAAGCGAGGGGAGTGGLVLWDVPTRKRLTVVPLPVKEGYVHCVAFSPDGRTIAAGHAGGAVALWDVAARKRLVDDPLPVKEGAVAGVAFSPDGKTIAAGYYFALGRGGGGAVLWDLATHKQLAHNPLPVTEGFVTGVAFSPDGGTIAAGFGRGAGVALWDVAARERLTDDPFPVKEGFVTGVAFSPDGTTIAAGYHDDIILHAGGVVLWDVATRKRLKGDPLTVKEGKVSDVAFSRDGRTIAASFYADAGGGVVLWDAVTFKRLMDDPLPVTEGYVRGVTYNSGGDIFAVEYDLGLGRGCGVALWDAATRKRLAVDTFTVKQGGATGLAFSHDGKTLAGGCGAGGEVLWDVATRKRRADDSFRVNEGDVSGVAFSTDGKHFAAAYIDNAGGGGAVLWDVAKRKRLADGPMPVNEGYVMGVAFSPDGTTIAARYSSRGGESGVVLWDVAAGQRLRNDPLPVKPCSHMGLAFSPDGKSIAAGYDVFADGKSGGGVVIWDIDLESWQCIAGRIANRNFTQEEWRRYFPDESYRRTFRELPCPSDLPETERAQAARKERETAFAREVSTR